MQQEWTGTAIQFYRRFTDELFFLCLGSREELEKFIIYVNQTRLPRFSETLKLSWKILIEDPVMKKI